MFLVLSLDDTMLFALRNFVGVVSDECINISESKMQHSRMLGSLLQVGLDKVTKGLIDPTNLYLVKSELRCYYTDVSPDEIKISALGVVECFADMLSHNQLLINNKKITYKICHTNIDSRYVLIEYFPNDETYIKQLNRELQETQDNDANSL